MKREVTEQSVLMTVTMVANTTFSQGEGCR